VIRSENRTVKVMVVEDEAEQRASLRAILNGTPGLRCVAVADGAERAMQEVVMANPDVVLLDLELPGLSGVDCIPALRQSKARPEVLVLTLHDEPEWIYPALAAGATGYLVKPASPEDLARAVFAIAEGGSPMSGPVARLVLRSFQTQTRENQQLASLTKRETEVLRLLSQGLQQKAIAGQLDISIRTVGSHLHKIYEKLHVHSATAATAKYLGGRT
jgi:DNA-binding NarL/FixJ family response regulator